MNEDIDYFIILKEVNGYLNLASNDFTNINWLSNLVFVNSELSFESNYSLNDISPLSWLVVDNLNMYEVSDLSDISVLEYIDIWNSISLNTTNVTNISVLSNFPHLNNIDIWSNSLSDLSWLNNHTATWWIITISDKNYTNKIDSNSSICDWTWYFQDDFYYPITDISWICN